MTKEPTTFDCYELDEAGRFKIGYIGKKSAPYDIILPLKRRRRQRILEYLIMVSAYSFGLDLEMAVTS